MDNLKTTSCSDSLPRTKRSTKTNSREEVPVVAEVEEAEEEEEVTDKEETDHLSNKTDKEPRPLPITPTKTSQACDLVASPNHNKP